jgi:uncharacterized protein (TIGR04255 family)
MADCAAQAKKPNGGPLDDKLARPHPSRLEPDAIQEALVEFRFETSELAEITVGRLSDATFWSSYSHMRLPVADIPQPIRDSDPTLRYQPIIEISRSDGLRAAKIGGRVLSYHVVNQYPGWDAFRAEIKGVLNHVSEKITDVAFIRIGFRYINLFQSDRHGIRDISDTNLSITLAGEKISSKVNLNYIKSDSEAQITVRITTPEIVTGTLPPNVSLLCDIDVATLDGFKPTNLDDLAAWIDRAHDAEKAEFFSLLPPSVVDRLTPINKEPPR